MLQAVPVMYLNSTHHCSILLFMMVKVPHCSRARPKSLPPGLVFMSPARTPFCCHRGLVVALGAQASARHAAAMWVPPGRVATSA